MINVRRYFDGAQAELGSYPLIAVVTSISGVGAATEGNDTATATGAVAITGTSAATEGNDTSVNTAPTVVRRVLSVAIIDPRRSAQSITPTRLTAVASARLAVDNLKAA